MTRRLLVNDALSQLGERTFWHMLQEWFDMEFVGGDYATLAEMAHERAVIAGGASLFIRNATWFPPIPESDTPTISLLQDIVADGPMREMQDVVCRKSTVVWNSAFTKSHYPESIALRGAIIPLPVDFSLFTPQNAMGCQQALGLPDGCVCWVGASHGAAGQVKGFDILLQIARLNPDIPFVAVFKDEIPASFPPNMLCYARLPQAELVKIIGACRVGLCTSRSESQHLAGIEMGACGLPLVVPPVGCYWKREAMRGRIVTDGKYADAIRAMLGMKHDGSEIRSYWQREFDIPVVRSAWEKLVAEVECSGRS